MAGRPVGRTARPEVTTATPSRPRTAPVGAPTGAAVVRSLQRAAGNRAVAAAVGPTTATPPVQRAPATGLDAPEHSAGKAAETGSGNDLASIVSGVLAAVGLSPAVVGWLQAAFGIDVLAAMAKAQTKDENKVTNELFFARHPQLGRRKLERHERALAKEWLDIRTKEVRPFLEGIRSATELDSADGAGSTDKDQTAKSNGSPAPAASPQEATGAKAPADAAPKLAEQMAAVKESKGKDRAKIDALIAYARKQTASYPDLVDTYRRQAEPDAEEKVRVLGKAAAGIARMEYLLGQMRYRGKSWEGEGSHGKNQGKMVDTYKASWARKKTAPWCTYFATSALARLYGKKVNVGSGLKVGRQRSGYDAATEHGGKQAGVFDSNSTTKNNAFARLRVELENLDDRGERVKAAKEFLVSEIRPQPGDVVIIRREGKGRANSAAGSQSHTLMVEGFSGTTMALIEGNKGGRVQGRRLDLAEADDVEEILLISRPSLTAGASKAKQATIGAGLAAAESAIGEADIVGPTDTLNAQLEELARSVGVLATDAPAGAAVADIHVNAGKVSDAQD